MQHVIGFYTANRRLRRFALHLSQHISVPIDLDDWVTYPAHKTFAEHNPENVLNNIVTGSNGVVACATIHACTIPIFNRLGLTIRVTLAQDALDVYVDPIYVPTGTHDFYYQGKNAICAFFGLSTDEYDYLFDPKSYLICGSASPLKIVKRITSLLSDRK